MITKDQVIELFIQGMSQRQITVVLNCSLNTVRRRMKQAGVIGRSKGISDSSIDEHFFDQIDTEQKAYWLGFLLADGCIAKSGGTQRAFRISLQKRDWGHLKKFAQQIGFNNKYYQDKRKHPRVVMVFNSVKMADMLLGHGWNGFKQFGNTVILSLVPVELRHHLIRGYFDGDGCLSRTKWHKSWYGNIVCKNRAPLDWFNSVISESIGIGRDVKYRETHRDDKIYSIYYLKWNGRQQLTTILDWLYRDYTVSLDRKAARRQMFVGNSIYSFTNLHEFQFRVTPDILHSLPDLDSIIDQFTSDIINVGWSPPVRPSDLDKLRETDIDKYISSDHIINGQPHGNQLVMRHQPNIWYVSQNKRPILPNMALHSRLVRRGITAFLTTGDSLKSSRLVREILYKGFTRASLLSAPVLMAAIKVFGLEGSWFDPCAGWGNRLLAAYVLGIKYAATDPGLSFPGLLKLKEHLNDDCILQNKRWQDAEWHDGFVLTSPPFWNKEDYIDNTEYGDFEVWYQDFIVGMIKKTNNRRIVLHLDKRITDRLILDYETRVVPLKASGVRRTPDEYFVEILESRPCVV